MVPRAERLVDRASVDPADAVDSGLFSSTATPCATSLRTARPPSLHSLASITPTRRGWSADEGMAVWRCSGDGTRFIRINQPNLNLRLPATSKEAWANPTEDPGPPGTPRYFVGSPIPRKSGRPGAD